MPYRGLPGGNRTLCAKLALHLHAYARAVGLEVPEANRLSRESTESNAGKALRLVLDKLKGGPFPTVPKTVEPPPPEFTLEDRILDANNRFSVLFVNWGKENDPGFVTNEENVGYGLPEEAITHSERAIVTRSRSNAVRVKLGYPPKPQPHSEEHIKSLEAKMQVHEHLRTLHKKIVEPLCVWRVEKLHRYAQGSLPKERLTSTPLTLLGLYENWYMEAKTFMVPWGLRKPAWDWDFPRAWDRDGAKTPPGISRYLLYPSLPEE
jgi:hypothetical protein